MEKNLQRIGCLLGELLLITKAITLRVRKGLLSIRNLKKLDTVCKHILVV